MKTNHNATATNAPRASQDQPGWRRRGPKRSIMVIEYRSSVRASGRANDNTVSSSIPNSDSTASEKVNAAISIAYPQSAGKPAINAISSALLYLLTVGRSRRMP